MDNTNKSCPPVRINNTLIMTDNRPSRALYTNVYDSNKYRKYMQENALKIMEEDRKKLDARMVCPSEMSYPELKYTAKPSK